MNSSLISSPQVHIHADLERLILKHQATKYLRPIPDFSRTIFAEIIDVVQHYQKYFTPQPRIILDSCSGTGESTVRIAIQNPDAFVIGCDKSVHRTNKHIVGEVSNYGVWRADVEDVWRQMGVWLREQAEEGRRKLQKHFLLYPNPYPKPHHILRRWHGHPLFPEMLALADETEMRTNWRIYAEEFAKGASILNYAVSVEEYVSPPQAMTAFERKYAASGHTLYRVVVTRAL